MRILFDTNVLLDVLLAREPFVADAAFLLEVVETRRVEGFLSATTPGRSSPPTGEENANPFEASTFSLTQAKRGDCLYNRSTITLKDTVMSQTIGSVRWTIQDVEALPDNEWIRYEIIDGELFVTRSPHHKHQQVTGRIFAVLDDWSLKSGLGEPSIMPGLIFSDSDNVAPDVVWVSYERLAQIQDEAGHFRGAPELVVEVLSPGKENEARDRLAKLKLYSTQGVREYWMIDRIAQRVEIYRRNNAQLTLVATLLIDDVITSPLLPNFACEVARLFVSRA